ncbi:MAG: DNA-directed RNA polymerase specialized sigma24 family protein [Verrucomicrobiales bacterium]|jgi:DNA-directed RNA polymerase specialized sigma24 family protein
MTANDDKPRLFSTTHWTLVIEAGNPDSAEVSNALEQLCSTYWFPLYAYARKAGHRDEEAKDLTQGFFEKLLEKNYLGIAARRRGRFRWFLLTAFKGFLANEWDRSQAQKRGGGKTLISWDQVSAEERYHLEPSHNQTPDLVYAKRWALTLLDAARKKLRTDYENQGKAEKFAGLEPHLLGGGERYADLATTLGTTEGALKQEIRRMRERFRTLLRTEVGNTVVTKDEIDSEIAYLMEILAN